jgi:hypothetical protein
LRSSRLLKIGVGLATVLLTAFHGLLLWERIADGSLLETGIAVEWAIGLLLLLALLRLKRLGTSLHRERAGVILWLLVSLLHAVASVPGHGVAFDVDVDRDLLVSLPLGVLVGAAVAYVVGTLSSRGRLLLSLDRGSLPALLPERISGPSSWAVPGCRAPPA